MLLNYIGKPSIYLPTSMVLWGVISCLTGQHLPGLVCRLDFQIHSRRHYPQLYGCLPYSVPAWFRRGCLLPGRPFPSIEVVQAFGAWSSHGAALLRSSHQQCIWLAHGLGYPQRDARDVGLCGMEVRLFRANCARIRLPQPFTSGGSFLLRAV